MDEGISIDNDYTTENHSQYPLTHTNAPGSQFGATGSKLVPLKIPFGKHCNDNDECEQPRCNYCSRNDAPFSDLDSYYVSEEEDEEFVNKASMKYLKK